MTSVQFHAFSTGRFGPLYSFYAFSLNSVFKQVFIHFVMHEPEIDSHDIAKNNAAAVKNQYQSSIWTHMYICQILKKNFFMRMSFFK